MYKFELLPHIFLKLMVCNFYFQKKKKKNKYCCMTFCQVVCCHFREYFFKCMLKRIYNIFEPYFGGMDFYVHVLFGYLLLIYDKIAQAMRLFLCIKKKKSV